MQTPQISQLEFYATPIKTIYIEWQEGDTDYNAHLPISWIMKEFGEKQVTDKKVTGAARSKFFHAAVKKYAHVLINKAKVDFAEHINSLTCSADAPTPEIFAA